MDSMPKEISTARINTGETMLLILHNKNKSVVRSVLSDHDDVMILFECNDID